MPEYRDLPDELLARGAETGSFASANAVLSFGNVQAEYDALRYHAGSIPLSWFRVLRVTGEDRVSWLHKLTTANVEGTAEGTGTYGLLLNATGHVVADFCLAKLKDQILLFAGKDAIDKLFLKLSKTIFREKVSIAPADDVVVFALVGKEAEKVASLAFGSAEIGSREHNGIILVKRKQGVFQIHELVFPTNRAVDVWDTLVKCGGVPAGLEAFNTWRIEQGIMWYGLDFDETMLAFEARLDFAIAENKGCYTGQEVIARIKNRGHVNRLLVQMLASGSVIPSRGDPVANQGGEIGWITSPAWSPVNNSVLALGYVRREYAGPDQIVQIVHAGSNIDARVIALREDK